MKSTCVRSIRRQVRRRAPAAGPWQISDQGGQGMAFWRRDGKELYYLAADRAIMAVSVDQLDAGQLEFGKPKLLFRPSEATPACSWVRRASAATASAS